MGKKKRPAGPAQIPLFYAKKRKLNEATQLTALVALHKYCAKFKLGAPGFRPLTTAPHHEVCVVMDGAELGRARHADRAGAMERAALLTQLREGKPVRLAKLVGIQLLDDGTVKEARGASTPSSSFASSASSLRLCVPAKKKRVALFFVRA